MIGGPFSLPSPPQTQRRGGGGGGGRGERTIHLEVACVVVAIAVAAEVGLDAGQREGGEGGLLLLCGPRMNQPPLRRGGGAHLLPLWVRESQPLAPRGKTPQTTPPRRKRRSRGGSPSPFWKGPLFLDSSSNSSACVKMAGRGRRGELRIANSLWLLLLFSPWNENLPPPPLPPHPWFSLTQTTTATTLPPSLPPFGVGHKFRLSRRHCFFFFANRRGQGRYFSSG